MNTLTISQLARRSGVPASTLRYYEKVGVIPPATRNGSGYRLYDEQALARLAFVQRTKALGVELDDLADLVRRSGTARNALRCRNACGRWCMRSGRPPASASRS